MQGCRLNWPTTTFSFRSEDAFEESAQGGRIGKSAAGQALGGSSFHHEERTTAEMDKLPLELLTHILSFIPATELYPSCFLICKRLLSALKDDFGWQQRCNTEFQLHQLSPEYKSWFEA